MYRATPLQNDLSPSELLMGRKLKTRVPIFPKSLKPTTPDHDAITVKEVANKEKQRLNFNQRHAARELPPLQPGDPVWIRDMKRSGEVVAASSSPRSCIIKTQKGTVRRNRTAIVSTPAAEPNAQPATAATPLQSPELQTPPTPMQQRVASQSQTAAVASPPAPSNKKVELHVRHATGRCTVQSAVRWVARKGKRRSQLTQAARTWKQATRSVLQNSDAAWVLVTVLWRS